MGIKFTWISLGFLSVMIYMMFKIRITFAAPGFCILEYQLVTDLNSTN